VSGGEKNGTTEVHKTGIENWINPFPFFNLHHTQTKARENVVTNYSFQEFNDAMDTQYLEMFNWASEKSKKSSMPQHM
jgi:hypothetical protein